MGKTHPFKTTARASGIMQEIVKSLTTAPGPAMRQRYIAASFCAMALADMEGV